MRYLSACSGIEAASVAWHPLGWEPVGFAEIDPFASAVLAHRFPHVRNFGNMEGYREWEIEPGSFDVLVAGTPCQSFSVAGLRQGLDDPRGNLALVYLGMVDHFRPRWTVWENVPGVLSSSGGRDFGSLLGGLADLGYGFAYRVLDAQYVRVDGLERAVPQRRRRVFVVGHSGGDAHGPAQVLLELASVLGDSPPRRASREEAARGFAARARGGDAGTGHRVGIPDPAYCLSAGAQSTGGVFGSGREGQDTFVVESGDAGVLTIFDTYNQTTSVDGSTQTLCSRGDTPGGVTHLVPAILAPLPFDTTQVTHRANWSSPQPGDPCHPLARDGHAPHVALPSFVWHVDVADPITANEQATYTHEGARNFRLHNVVPDAVAAPTLTSANDPSRSPQSAEVTQQVAAVHATTMQVRRLTPRECERLQGFPDDWTAIPWRGKATAVDGPRYKALGNSMAVNVMRWIGTRLAAYERAEVERDERDERDEEDQVGRSEHTLTTNDEVCTPAAVYEPIIAALGPIAFDPASHPASNVPASTVVLLPKYWTDPSAPVPAEQECGEQLVIWGSGLDFDWGGMGLVFVNPPYSTLAKEPWIAKARLEADEAVLFLPVRTAGAWWQDEVSQCQAVTFLRGRVTHDGAGQGAPFHQALVYCGPRVDQWVTHAAGLGWTVLGEPWSRGSK